MKSNLKASSTVSVKNLRCDNLPKKKVRFLGGTIYYFKTNQSESASKSSESSSMESPLRIVSDKDIFGGLVPTTLNVINSRQEN